MKITVIGAGIGGLAVALACARDGHEVTVVERAEYFGEVGAGIQISPNGMRVLAWLGLVDDHLAVATTPERVVIRRWQDDSVIGVTTLGDDAIRRHGLPYTNVYRPDLIDVLVEGVRREQCTHPKSIDIVFGAEPVAIVESSSGVRVRLSTGDEIGGHLVIGADGIHSAVRDHLVDTGVLGGASSRYSGYVAYRALVPRERVEDLPTEVTNRLGPDRHVVTYFVGRERRFLNIVAFVPETSWALESWTEPGRLDDLIDSYVGWSPELQRLLTAIEPPVFRWAMHDRQPLPRWSDGRITLLGDACHAMLPFMAQGGCQGLEDAVVLTRCLHDIDPENSRAVTDALVRYENTRRERTSLVQERSWRNATVFHLPDGPDQRRRDTEFARRTALEALALNDWLYGYDAVTAALHPPAD
jgi:salicylate hydroxylase